jgi:hypothetical protein
METSKCIVPFSYNLGDRKVVLKLTLALNFIFGLCSLILYTK